MKFYQHELKNGLQVIGEERPGAKSAAVGFFVKAGARDESPEVSGVSHFLEHMMFKGTANRTALEITFDLGTIGAQANAYTSEENTVYYAAVLPEYLEQAFDIISDMLRPSLDEEEFTVEKKVILEEIALYQDRPNFLLFEAALREFFHEHPAGNSVLGSTESITALTVEQMREYFNSHYSASNIVLSVSGCFDWDRVVELAEKTCSSWPSQKIVRDHRKHIHSAREKTLYKADLQQALVCLVAPGPSAQEDERYEAKVLSVILGDMSGSRAYWELVDKGLADSASIDCDDMDHAGIIYAFLSAPPERIDEVTETLQGILKTPMEFSDLDLERAITKIGTRLVLQGESTMRRLTGIGSEWIYRNRYSTLEDELARVKKVTRASIEQFVQKYPLDSFTKVRLLPES